MGLSSFRLEHAALDDLIAEAQAAPGDNSSAMNEIILRFDGLATQIGRRLTADPVLQAVVANTARLELVKVVRRHSGQAGFPSYAKLCMRFAALREWKHAQRSAANETTVDFEDPELGHLVAVETVNALGVWGDGPIAAIIPTLKPPQQELLAQRYVDGMTLKDIGERTGTTPSAVHQRLITAHRAVRQAMAA